MYSLLKMGRAKARPALGFAVPVKAENSNDYCNFVKPR